MITPDTIPPQYQPLRTWWDKHPDRYPNDFGAPIPNYYGEPMTPEEESAFYEAHALEEIPY